MDDIGIWHVVKGNQPLRLRKSVLPNEKQLEDWIESDPTLIAPGLRAVRRQVPLGRKALDLLGVEEPGTWVLCELKKMTLEREVFAQALDYFARMRELNIDDFRKLVTESQGFQSGACRDLIERALEREEEDHERAMRIVLVGVDVKEELDRMVNVMVRDFKVPIQICTFSAIKSPMDDGLILMRDISEDVDVDEISQGQGTTYDQRMESVTNNFKSNGTDVWLQKVLNIVASNQNLHAAPRKLSLMIAPERHHGRYLIYLTPRKSGVYASFGYEALQEFFPSADLDLLAGLPGDAIFDSEQALVDWVQTISNAIGINASNSNTDEKIWNGKDWYFSFGQGPDGRNWDDAVEHGFVSAGGGDWYSRTLKSLPVGANIFVRIPKKGYVGWGITTGEAMPQNEFSFVEGKPLRGDYEHGNSEPEYFVPVSWKKTVPESKAFDETGLFANENSACRLRDPKTVEKLHSYFGVPANY